MASNKDLNKANKAKKDEFEVDGKDRNCAGYTLTIDEDNLQDMVDAILKTMEEYDEFEMKAYEKDKYF